MVDQLGTFARNEKVPPAIAIPVPYYVSGTFSLLVRVESIMFCGDSFAAYKLVGKNN